MVLFTCGVEAGLPASTPSQALGQGLPSALLPCLSTPPSCLPVWRAGRVSGMGLCPTPLPSIPPIRAAFFCAPEHAPP